MRAYYLFLLAVILSFNSCSCSSGSSGDSDGCNDCTAPAVREFFIDPIMGDDSNAGREKSSPLKSLGSLKDLGLRGADSVYLKRGSIFRETLVVPVSGTEGSPIYFGAYGEGDTPLIFGSERETGWSLESGSVYKKTIDFTGGGAGIVAQDGTPLKFIAWNSDSSATFSGASPGSYSYNPSTGEVYVWCSDGSSPDSHEIEVSRRYYGIHGEDVSYIAIENIEVRFASLHGILLKNASGISVHSCTVTKCGGAYMGGGLYAGNGIEAGNNASGIKVSNCTVTDIFDSGVTPQTYASDVKIEGMTIEDTVIKRCGFAGIEIAVLQPGGVSGASIDGVTVRGCEVSLCGTGFSGVRYGNEGRGIKVTASSGAGSVRNVVIKESRVFENRGEGLYGNGDSGAISLHRVKVYDNNLEGIHVAAVSAPSLKLKVTSSIIYGNGGNDGADDKSGIVYNVPDGAGLEVLHCTIYENGLINLYVAGYSGSVDIINTIFSSSSVMTHFYSENSITGIINYNCYHENGGNIIGYSGSAYTSVSAFNGSTGHDGGSTGSAPLFTDPAGSDFHLTVSSPCRGTGTALSAVKEDYSGTAFSSSPSMGALEY